MSRPIDLSFGVGERLWRRIETGHVSDTSVKPNAIRLQVSVTREKYGTRELVCQGKFNGIAETTAGDVAGLSQGQLQIVCVDEPVMDNEAHALIAMVLAPGIPEELGAVNILRALVARKFQIVLKPTKVR